MLMPLSIDMYLPALPVIAAQYNVPDGSAQMTLSTYILGFALGQLLYGPMADSLGRKPVILGGTLVFAAAAVACALSQTVDMLMIDVAHQGVNHHAGRRGCQSVEETHDNQHIDGLRQGAGYRAVACALSQTVDMLIVMRFFHGLAAAAASVVINALMRDIYHQHIDGLRQGAGYRRRREDQRPAEDHRLAAKAVRHRAVQQLTQRKAEDIGAERHLRAAVRDVILGGDHRQGRKIHINRQRHQHGQQAKT